MYYILFFHSAKLRLEDVLKTSSKNLLSSLGRLHMVLYVTCIFEIYWGCQFHNLTLIYKMRFYGFFSIFPDSNCMSDIALPM